jgi:uncharacterized RDD family membrane protein YckC
MEVSKLNRFLGYFIDALVGYIPMFIFGFLAGMLEMFSLVWIGYVLFLGYFLLRDALFGGQSIGKKAMKYKVVKEDGSSLAGDYMASLTRNVSLFIPLVDLIMVLTDKPRLGDGWAKTKVVNA